MSKPTDAAARVDEIKTELRQWLQHRLQYNHAPAALAILEVALELYIADLGQHGAKKIGSIGLRQNSRAPLERPGARGPRRGRKDRHRRRRVTPGPSLRF
jgi:hypothetical protein